MRADSESVALTRLAMALVRETPEAHDAVTVLAIVTAALAVTDTRDDDVAANVFPARLAMAPAAEDATAIGLPTAFRTAVVVADVALAILRACRETETLPVSVAATVFRNARVAFARADVAETAEIPLPALLMTDSTVADVAAIALPTCFWTAVTSEHAALMVLRPCFTAATAVTPATLTVCGVVTGPPAAADLIATSQAAQGIPEAALPFVCVLLPVAPDAVSACDAA